MNASEQASETNQTMFKDLKIKPLTEKGPESTDQKDLICNG